MARQTINIGAAPNDGTGDPLRVGGDSINDNFIEAYAQFRGDWAGTTTLPSTGGRHTGGVPLAGDEWRLTNQLVIGGFVYPAGTIIKAMINTPGQTLTNWAFLAVQL